MRPLTAFPHGFIIHCWMLRSMGPATPRRRIPWACPHHRVNSTQASNGVPRYPERMSFGIENPSVQRTATAVLDMILGLRILTKQSVT